MYTQYTDKSGKAESDYFQSLYAESRDSRGGPPPRLRYAILAQARTGSELIAAYLRRRGVGIPLEYFHHASMPLLATRWGSLDAAGGVDLQRYCAELERRRTSSTGAFGNKILVGDLNRVTNGNTESGLALLQGFDKIVLTRRRDTLRQATSLLRAMSTGQWHVLPGDEQKRVAPSDLARLFARLTYCWARILDQERDMARLEAGLPRAKLRTVWYEDLTDPGTLPAIFGWLCAESGIEPQPEAADHPLPIRGDAREADGIIKAYIDFIAATPL